jgi:hypothetical protein
MRLGLSVLKTSHDYSTGPDRRVGPSSRRQGALFFNLPLGTTVVTGGMGRSEVDSRGAELSFFGFFDILLLRCSPLGMVHSSFDAAM